MAALNPYFQNAGSVSVSSDGVTATADAYGELMADGSTLPEPEVQTDALLSGAQLAAGATWAATIRVLRADDAVTADLAAARDDGTTRYFHFASRSGGHVTVVGPCYVTAVYERPPLSGAARGSVVVAFNAAGDTPDDFLAHEVVT